MIIYTCIHACYWNYPAAGYLIQYIISYIRGFKSFGGVFCRNCTSFERISDLYGYRGRRLPPSRLINDVFEWFTFQSRVLHPWLIIATRAKRSNGWRHLIRKRFVGRHFSPSPESRQTSFVIVVVSANRSHAISY